MLFSCMLSSMRAGGLCVLCVEYFGLFCFRVVLLWCCYCYCVVGCDFGCLVFVLMFLRFIMVMMD